jgi:hypothetical protein
MWILQSVRKIIWGFPCNADTVGSSWEKFKCKQFATIIISTDLLRNEICNSEEDLYKVSFSCSPPATAREGSVAAETSPLLSVAPPTHLAATPTVCHPHPSQHSHLPKSIPPNEAWKHASTLALCLYVQTKHFYVTGRNWCPLKHGSSEWLLFLFLFLFAFWLWPNSNYRNMIYYGIYSILFGI